MSAVGPGNPLGGRVHFREFVAFIAACMALNALAIDIMLPALPDLTRDFHLADPNHAQAVIAVYLVGMGVSQLFYGPLSDRFGRRLVLVGGLLLFSVAGLLSAMSVGFEMLLVAHFSQGLGADAGAGHACRTPARSRDVAGDDDLHGGTDPGAFPGPTDPAARAVALDLRCLGHRWRAGPAVGSSAPR